MCMSFLLSSSMKPLVCIAYLGWGTYFITILIGTFLIVRRMQIKEEVMVLLSGGIDSMATVHFFAAMRRKPCAMFIDYGQAALLSEKRSAAHIAKFFRINLLTAHWDPIIPKHAGYIAGRNAFLLLAGLMEKPPSVTTIALGIHAGTSYSDCSSHFVDEMQKIFDIYCDGRTHISCPFIDFQKIEIFSYCKENHLPLELTYSCESGPNPCGKCLSCKDRELLNASP